MAQRQQYITLDSVIYDYINEAELSQNKYFKLFHIAFQCMDDLGMDFFYQIKSVKLPVNANKTITLPADYLNYTKIGVMNGSGGVIPLTFNSSLSLFQDLNPSRIADTTSDNFSNIYSPSSPMFFNYWNGQGYENLYGAGYTGLYGGGFRIDNANGVILLDGDFGYNGTVLEYVASPKEGEEYHVPVQFRGAIIAWLAWRDIANLAPKRGMAGVVQQRRHEYFEARRLAITKWHPFYLDQAYMNNQASMKMVVKS